MDWSKIDNSPAALRRFLEEEGLAPKKRWGQNFMVSPGARSAVVTALGVRPDDLVWEIGPGFGAITALLVEAALLLVASSSFAEEDTNILLCKLLYTSPSHFQRLRGG